MQIEPHAVLGLAPDAPREVIVSTWRTFVLEHHPDRGGDAERFRLARWAYDCMTDPCDCDDASCRRKGHRRRPPRDGTGRGPDRRRTLVVPAGIALAGGAVLDDVGRQIRIAPDTGIGDEIRLVGMGGPGRPPGDLYLTIEVRASPPWRVSDLDLVGPLPVTWLELYQGRTVQLFIGAEATCFPVGPETPPLSVIQIPGRGLRRGDERGSLQLVVTPVAPASGDKTLEGVLVRLQLDHGSTLRSQMLSSLNLENT